MGPRSASGGDPGAIVERMVRRSMRVPDEDRPHRREDAAAGVGERGKEHYLPDRLPLCVTHSLFSPHYV